jgi:hypothetical protein
VHVYTTKTFRRFQRKERIGDATLLAAVHRADAGLVDAELGGGLIKQRVARHGQGKSGGYRTLIAYRTADRAVYLFGFAKSSQANIDPTQLVKWQALAAHLLVATDDAIEKSIAADELKEVL